MRRGGIAVATPGDCEVEHHLADGAVSQAQRVLQLQEDARSSFLQVEASVITARRAAQGDVEPPPPSAPPARELTLPPPPNRKTLVLAVVCATLAATAGLIVALNAATTSSHGPAVVADLEAVAPLQIAVLSTEPAPVPAAQQPAAGGIQPDYGQSVYAARFASVPAIERTCLARAIYYEARGESSEGQIAVAQVVLNRARSKKWPHSICGVVNQGVERGEKCQFSFACNTRLSEPSGILWEEADLVATQAINGQAWLRELMEATHYHTTSVAPIWRLGLVQQATIGSHIFYREATGLRESPKVAPAYAALASVKAARVSLAVKPPAAAPLNSAVIPAKAPGATAAVSASKAIEKLPLLAASPAPAPAPRKPAGSNEPDWKASIFEH